LAHFDSLHDDRARRAGRGRARALSSLGLLALLCACTELAPGGDRLPQQFRSVQPDAGLVTDDTRWGCLDAPETPSASPLVPRVDLALTVIDTVTGAPPAGLSARACSRLDVDCDNPLTPDVAAAIDGAMHLSVPQQFNGFVEIRSPATVPTMYFINQNLMRDTAESFSIISILALAGLAMQGNVMLEPGLGHVLIRTFDCQGEPASGVQLSNDKGGQPFAFVDGFPAVGRNETTGDGIGGFVNVPLDYVVLQGIVREHGTPLSNASVIVRPGWFSYGDVEPLPE
jgi:hypothetical protein